MKSSGLSLASLGAATMAPSFLTRAMAGTKGRGKILIAIFQRGAADGLNMVVPHGEQAYYDLRNNIAIPRPKAGAPEAAIDLDGFFGLHPALAPFKPLWDRKQLAIVHASGSPDNTRSHFDAQDYMESATPGVKSTRDGWLNRYLQANAADKATPFRGVAMGPTMPRAMQGRAASLAVNNLSEFGIRGGGPQGNAQSGFEALYEQAVDTSLRNTGHETFEAVRLLKKANPAQHQTSPQAQYPRTRYGESLRQIAQLIKSDIGLEIAFTDIGGWDTHQNEGTAQGQLAGRLLEFGQGIAALYTDLGDRAADVIILSMTEFGRTARENGTRGTDHGHASAMFVLGGEVGGGQVYGKWPGLRDEQLYEGRDLNVTTDFRDVFAEIATRHLGAAGLGTIFPGYQVSAARYKNFLRA
ncbi:MAG: DUF1501 domain-containing protein [Blastocatellia bacterium]